MLKALADRLAEAFAERCTSECGANSGDMRATRQLDSTGLIREEYRGIRPAPGLPRLPGSYGEGDAVGTSGCGAKVGLA